MPNLSKHAARKPKKNGIPRGAAVNDRIPEEFDRVVVFHFRDYVASECEIEKLNPASLRESLDMMKRAGKGPAYKLNDVSVKTKKTHADGNYERLFRDLDPDVKVFHHDLGSGERVFYYLSGREFRVLAFRSSHYNSPRPN